MGTTPLRECRRRSRNEMPSPARSGATPDLIFGAEATGLPVDATMTAPYVVRCANWLLSFCAGREVKGEIKERALVPEKLETKTANDTFLNLKTLSSRQHTTL